MNKVKNIFKIFFLLISVLLSSCFNVSSSNSISEDIPEYVQVVFYDGDNTILYKTSIEKGSNAVYEGSTPCLNVEGKNATFEKWDKPLENILVDTNFYPLFTMSDIYYVINFYNYDNTILDTLHVKHGEDIVYDKIPNKPSDDYYEYTFNSWTSVKNTNFTNIKSNIDFYPIFDSKRHSYKVTFVDYNDEILEEKPVKIGEYATYSKEIPTKSDDVYGSYTFDKFTPDITSTIITQDTIFKATYIKTPKEYHIVFKDYDGSILYETQLYYQYSFRYPYALPTRVSDDPAYCYEFDKWVPQGDYTYSSLVRCDMEFVASYTLEKTKFSVKFEGYSSYYVYYGTIIYPEAGLKSPNDGYTRDFIDWDYDFSKPVVSNVEIKAIWTDWYYKKDGLSWKINYNAGSNKYTFYVKCANDTYKTFLIGYQNIYVHDENNITHVATIAGVEDEGFKLNQTVKKVVFDNVSSLTYIGFEAFYKCQNLETVIMNEYIEKIEDYAFYGCKNLKTVYIPSSVNYLGESCFAFAGEPDVFYGGTVEQFKNIETVDYTYLGEKEVYYYSETIPTDTEYKYWHYVEGVMTPWEI